MSKRQVDRSLAKTLIYIVLLVLLQWEINWLQIDNYFLFFQGKFLSFYQFAKSFNSDEFDYDELNTTDFVFMRWKVGNVYLFSEINSILIKKVKEKKNRI